MTFLQSAFVVGRRDFVATVASKTFLLFLLGPLFPLAFGVLFGNLGESVARKDNRTVIAIVAPEAEFREIAGARTGLNTLFAGDPMPELLRVDDVGGDAGVDRLLADEKKNVRAVLTGGVDAPRLTGAVGKDGNVRRSLTLILNQVRQQRALAAAGTSAPPVQIAVRQVDQSAGSVASAQTLTARLGQFLLFMLTILLAVQLLSNLIEEKSNKVIEILAAALPIDAIFVGKLFAMLAVSLVGITVWAIAAVVGLSIWLPPGFTLPEPAVGWPMFVGLGILYYSMAYLLLGALFLGIGSQASTVREVQTLSMPVTMGQVAVLLLASAAVGAYATPLGIAAMLVPFSSPFTMLARSAQMPEVWPHLLALAWQALWVFLIVRFGSRLFRSSVLKSGPSTSPWWRFGRAGA
jgi:ABC-2 type transport system permease protein